MEHIVSFLYHVFGAILFCMALTFCFLGFNKFNGMLENAINNTDYGVIDWNRNMQAEPITTNSEIVALFITGLEQDVVVDGVMYEKEIANLNMLDEIRFSSTTYKRTSIYNEATKELERIIFIPLG